MSNFTQLRCPGDLEGLHLRRHLETRDSSGRFSGSVALCRSVARGEGALDRFTRSSCPPAALAEVAGCCSQTEDVVMASPALAELAGRCSQTEDVAMASPALEDAALEESAGPLSDEDDDEDRFLWFCHSVVLPEVLVAGVSPA